MRHGRSLRIARIRTIESGSSGDQAVLTCAHTPTNARVERYLPHRPMGITQKALAAGVPVCAIPFGRDQFEVARRVAVTDAGVMLPKSKLSAKRVREAVVEAMAKAPGAQRVAASFEAAGGASAAADAMEQLLTGHRALDPA
jgi:hypothetical protein